MRKVRIKNVVSIPNKKERTSETNKMGNEY